MEFLRTLAVLALLGALPAGQALPNQPEAGDAPLGPTAPGIRPTHHEGTGPPSRPYNWAAHEDSPPSDAPIVIHGVVRPANDPLVIEGHVWNHKDATDCTTGILITNSQNIVVRNNEFYWICRGIRVFDSAGVTIEDNYFQDTSSTGVRIVRSEDIIFRRNVVQSMEMSWNPPVCFAECRGGRLFAFEGVANLVVEQNRIHGMQVAVGVMSALSPERDITNVRISHNTFEGNDVAISASSFLGLHISHNLVHGAGWLAFGLSAGSDAIIDNNTFASHYVEATNPLALSSNGWGGVRSFSVTNLVLRDNDFWANEYGYLRLASGAVNHGYAVQNLGTTPIDARFNWWGSPAGPGIPPGGAIQGPVDYSPWSLQPHHPLPPPPQWMPFGADHPPPVPRIND